VTHQAAWCAVGQQVCAAVSRRAVRIFHNGKKVDDEKQRIHVAEHWQNARRWDVTASVLVLAVCVSEHSVVAVLCLWRFVAGLLPRRTMSDPWLYGIRGGQSGSACSKSTCVFPCQYHSTLLCHRRSMNIILVSFVNP